MAVKKEGWGGGGTRTLSFTASGDSDFPLLKPSGKTLNVSIARGLPKDTSKILLPLVVVFFPDISPSTLGFVTQI